MSNQITFRLNDEETLRKLSDKAVIDNVSINIAARNMLVELAAKDDFLQTKNIKVAVRNLTVLQRFISASIG